MRRHYKVVHLDIRRYPCQTCDKRFFQVSDLKRHVPTCYSRARAPGIANNLIWEHLPESELGANASKK